jgi:hypothetical protein
MSGKEGNAMGRESISWTVPVAFFTAAMILSAVLGPSGKALARRAPQDPSSPCPCVLDIHKLRVHARAKNWNVSMPPETSTGSLVFDDPESFEDVQGDGGEMSLEVKLLIGLGPGMPPANITFEKTVTVLLQPGEDITCREPELLHTEYPTVTFPANELAGFLEAHIPPLAVTDYVPNPNGTLKASCRVFGETRGFGPSGEGETCEDSLEDTRDINFKNGRGHRTFHARK